MKSYESVGLISLLALAAACAPKPVPPPDAAAIRAAITAQEEKFLPAMQKKDVAAIVPLFTDDATWILPDASTFTGKAEIEKGGKAFFDMFDSIVPGAISIDRLIVVSDSEAVSFSHGTFAITMKGKKKAENHINPFADHWKKGADGVWRISYEINAEGLVPEPTAAKKG